MLPTPAGSHDVCITNNNTDFDRKHKMHTCIHAISNTQTHSLSLSLFAFRVNANASGGNRVLKRCHHHSLQEAIIERKLIYCADIPASFLPRAAYPLWVIGNIG